mgnify:CR=1 FL=1
MKPALLLIEDCNDHAELAAEVLRDALGEELSIVRVKSMQQARGECLRTAFDVIVLDLGLPDSNGLESLREIRLLTKAPVIVLSGTVDASSRARAMVGGAMQAIRKENIVALPGLVADAIQHRSQLREQRHELNGKIDAICGVLEHVQADVALIRAALFATQSGPGLINRVKQTTRLAWLAVACSIAGLCSWLFARFNSF